MAYSGLNEHHEGCRKQSVLNRAAYSRKLMMAGLIPKDVSSYQPPYDESEEDAPGYMRKMGSPPGFRRAQPDQCLTMSRDDYYRRDYYHMPTTYPLDLAGTYGRTAVDRLRRDQVRAQQLVAYSAKIPNRFNSVNYTQQW